MHEAAEAIRSQHPLDLLIANAGVMAIPARSRRTGSRCSWPPTTSATSPSSACSWTRCSTSTASRVVSATSGAHRGGKIDFDDLQGERHYRKWTAYSQSKLANLLFAERAAAPPPHDGQADDLHGVPPTPGYASDPPAGGRSGDPLRQTS